MTRFPCPNCGKQRSSVTADCDACHYPKHQRTPKRLALAPAPRRPFQFHLRTLLVAMTIAAIAFAVSGRLGLTTFARSILFAVVIGGSFMPLVEFYYWWKRQGFEDN